MHATSRGLGVLTIVLCSIAGCTNTDSPAAKPLAAGSRPNILLIVADDLGYSDLGVFGSEIHTPNIDRLAARGTILTNYYTAPLCAPTRAMLLSGTDNHRAGEGLMDRAVEDAPGYEGYLNHRVVSLATRLGAGGYHTFMAGKWHLGYGDDQSPTAHGFERAFTLLQGGADHFAMTGIAGAKSTYRDNGKVVEALPNNFYSARYYTDKMIGYLKEQAGDGKPFFAYLAYTSPHWPIQAPDEDIARQRGRYDEGYEILRQRRFEAWKAAGFGPKDAPLPNLPPDYAPWDSLSPEEKAKSARTMEVYAAMVEHMDSEIGRVIKYLQDTGQFDNTLILFQSDNGAEGAANFVGAKNADNSLDNIGRPGSWVSIGPGWAQAAAAPYHRRKFFTSEGGIHVPAIVSAPALGVPAGRRDDSVLIASDVAPTFLELAGADLASPSNGPDVLPITGRSFAGVLRGDNSRNRRGPNDVLGWEHSGQAAIRKGDWKLLWMGSQQGGGGPPPGAAPGGTGPGPVPAVASRVGPAPGSAAAVPTTPGRAPVSRQGLEAGGPAGDPSGNGGPWRLFNLRDDPGELHDLSKQHPDVMADLMTEWNRYVADNGVIVKKGTDTSPK